MTCPKNFDCLEMLKFLFGRSTGLKLPHHGHVGNFHFYFSFSLFTWYLWQLLLPRGLIHQVTRQNILWHGNTGVYTLHTSFLSTDMNVHVWYTTALQFYILMISFDPSISWFSFLCFIVSIWPHLPSPGIDHTSPLFGKMIDLETMGRHLTFLGCFAWCYLRGIKSLVPLRDRVMSWWIPMLFPEKQKAKQKAAVLASSGTFLYLRGA